MRLSPHWPKNIKPFLYEQDLVESRSDATKGLEMDVTKQTVELRVNGQPSNLELDPRTSLLDALREHLHLTGTKKGCDHGQCGACTVLINGQRINSCLTLA